MTEQEIPNTEIAIPVANQEVEVPIISIPDTPLPENAPECPLCGKKVKALETRGKNKGCRTCLDNITSPIRNVKYNIGRNQKCPCNSGKKFKKCCGKDQ